MTTQTTSTSVQSSVVVDAPIDRAFSVFTEGIATWWPPDHHILQGELADMIFEPRQGGDIYDRGVDGSECAWARVLAYEPPTRVVISWDISLQWQIETDPQRTSEVEVRFIAERPDRTRGARTPQPRSPRRRLATDARRSGSPDGWTVGLHQFAQRLNN